ncbi:MAG: hypothetical protein QOH65_1161, partial [Methylobacteriaceae bacterium]|nr:hypothetical protein [Methylobacteriaceae bacterium]
MNVPRVFQFHSGSAVGDAVTNSLLYVHEILSDYGIEAKIFVEHRDPRLSDRLSLIGEFRPRSDDLLLIHHSMGHDIMPFLRALPCRKILIYHNVTPPSFFDQDPVTRKYATKGLQQVEELRKFVAGAVAVSGFNAEELRRRGYDDPVVIPLLRDFTSIRFADFNPAMHYFEAPRYQVLFVGRISANKGQLHLINFLDQYRDTFEYPLYLTLVGYIKEGDPYASELLKTVERAGLRDQVSIPGHLSEKDLYGHFRAADAYVSFSEHEGFGVPLLEAMAFDVPVVAFEAGAIADTLGGSGIKLKTTEPHELAEQLHRIFSNRSHRREVIRGQRKRLMDFERGAIGAKLIEFLGPHLPTSAVARAP